MTLLPDPGLSEGRNRGDSYSEIGSGARIRTDDLRVMSPTAGGYEKRTSGLLVVGREGVEPSQPDDRTDALDSRPPLLHVVQLGAITRGSGSGARRRQPGPSRRPCPSLTCIAPHGPPVGALGHGWAQAAGDDPRTAARKRLRRHRELGLPISDAIRGAVALRNQPPVTPPRGRPQPGPFPTAT